MKTLIKHWTANNWDSLLSFLLLKQKLSQYYIKEEFSLVNDFLNQKGKKHVCGPNKKFFSKKIIMLALRRGLKLKFFNYANTAFKLFFYLFTHNNLGFFSKYMGVYSVYYSFFNLTNLFFNLNFLLLWLSNIFEPMFTIKCLSVPKKYRKKLKKRFIFTVFFLKKEKRKNIFLRWLYLNTFLFNDRVFSMKLFKSILDIFLKNKDSNLYLKKIVIYKKIFKKLS